MSLSNVCFFEWMIKHVAMTFGIVVKRRVYSRHNSPIVATPYVGVQIVCFFNHFYSWKFLPYIEYISIYIYIYIYLLGLNLFNFKSYFIKLTCTLSSSSLMFSLEISFEMFDNQRKAEKAFLILIQCLNGMPEVIHSNARQPRPKKKGYIPSNLLSASIYEGNVITN